MFGRAGETGTYEQVYRVFIFPLDDAVTREKPRGKHKTFLRDKYGGGRHREEI
jgi:hypothetical protein